MRGWSTVFITYLWNIVQEEGVAYPASVLAHIASMLFLSLSRSMLGCFGFWCGNYEARFFIKCKQTWWFSLTWVREYVFLHWQLWVLAITRQNTPSINVENPILKTIIKCFSAIFWAEYYCSHSDAVVIWRKVAARWKCDRSKFRVPLRGCYKKGSLIFVQRYVRCKHTHNVQVAFIYEADWPNLLKPFSARGFTWRGRTQNRNVMCEHHMWVFWVYSLVWVCVSEKCLIVKNVLLLVLRIVTMRVWRVCC